MSERIGGEAPVLVQTNMATAYRACEGAPATLKPGCVVAMAKSLQAIVAELDLHQGDPINQQWMGSPMRTKARAALAMYNGGDDEIA